MLSVGVSSLPLSLPRWSDIACGEGVQAAVSSLCLLAVTRDEGLWRLRVSEGRIGMLTLVLSFQLGLARAERRDPERLLRELTQAMEE